MFSLIYMIIVLIILTKLLQHTRTVNKLERYNGKGSFHQYVVSGRYAKDRRKGSLKPKRKR